MVSPPAAALERWKQLKFQQIQNELDSAAADIAVRQEESESGRKRLIELSREFRQTTSEEVRRQVQPLLKSFQTEVDSLVKRSKSAETAFLDVYKTFADLPDPTSIIEYLAHLEEKVVESKQLRETLEEYDRQLIANKAQEAKVARDQLADTEVRIEAAVQERLKGEVDQLKAEFADRQTEWGSEKATMERRLCDAEDQVGILRRELDRSHVEMSRARMMTGQTQDEKITLFAEDLDRATERAASAEYKISELEQQVTSLQKQVNNKTQESLNGNVEVPTSRGQQNQQDAVQRLRDELDRLKGSYQTQFDRMEDQLSRLSSQNTLLLRKLDAQRDYEDMKQQLSLLKSAHYSDDLSGGSLESILNSRNRRLENENASLRVRESELAGIRHQTNGNGKGNGNGGGGGGGNGGGVTNSRSSSDGEPDTRSSPSPLDEDDRYSDDLGELGELGELELANLTPEMMVKIADAKAVLQSLNALQSHGSSARFMNTMEVADQVNRVLEEEGITRCALAKFVLHGSYKMVYDALHDPRPWGFLNSAGRDKYRKLKIWAEDARFVNAVKVLQVYCKDKRRRSDAQPPSFTEESFYRNGGSTPHSIDALLGGGMDEPTDLSLPKMPNNGRRKSFQPQRDMQLGTQSAGEPERNYWLPKPSVVPASHPKSFTSNRRSHPTPSEYSHEAPSPSPKRISPQHMALQNARRLSRDTQVNSCPPALFRPSASFTASPVALGISFPDYRKNVLHQITDDMINQYDPLDTDQVTRAVRSKLNKCNVSQRLFGEVVLGMSQGAVSDLLKRPKPWNKLTRPTKEHYVRMQQFLEDENSIPVLQAIQNREDPERILATVGSEETEEEKADGREGWSKEDSPHLPTQAPPSSCIPTMTSSTTASSVVVSGRGPETVLSESDLSEREAFQAVKDHFTKFYQITDVSRSGMLDTVTVASRIKEELRSRNLQQKLIGELVLDVGQGTVSELLNKPKPYGMLSMKGRENYMKLLKLLQTAEDFTLLEALRTQGQQKANATKRTRASSDGESSSEKRSRTDTGLDESDHSGVDAENHVHYTGTPPHSEDKNFSKSLRGLEAEHLRQSDLMKEQTRLMKQLENDLYYFKEMSSPAKDSLSGLSLSEPDFVTDALRSESANIPTSAGLSRQSSSVEGSPAPDASLTHDIRLGASYLPILERQHERFYAKIKELEKSNHDVQSQAIALKTEMDAVKVDNVRLYERIRFLQSYEGRKSADQRAGSVYLSVGASATDAESRYSSAYEANLDPFSSFHRAEKQRRYDALGPVDKATLAMGNMVLGSSISRKGFFIYALLLHLLIFAVVYKMAWTESSIRDFSYDCSNRFAAHMQKVHGNGDHHDH